MTELAAFIGLMTLAVVLAIVIRRAFEFKVRCLSVRLLYAQWWDCA